MHRNFFIVNLTLIMDDVLCIPLDKFWIFLDFLVDEVSQYERHHEVFVLLCLPDVTLVEGIPLHEGVNLRVVLRHQVLHLEQSEEKEHDQDSQ